MRFSSLFQMLSFRASEHGSRTALFYEAGGERAGLSYFELFDLVQRRANDLRASGKTSIGILTDGSLDCVITIMASIVSGLQTVLLDENTPDALLKGYIAYTDIDFLWSSDSELTREFSPYLTGGVKSGVGRVLFFTSGTTSRSKAVVLTDESLMSSAYNGGSLLPLEEDDVLLCQLPLNHVFGFVCGLLWGLSCGAAVALGRGARHYIDDCAFFAPTAISLVPLLLGFLLKHNSLNEELRLVLIGAGDCPPRLISACASMGLRVSFGYGLTETSSGVALSLGADPYAMTVCPDDEVIIAEDGEILISAPTCVMEGYYKMPDATREVLSGGILRTGDLGFIDGDGLLHVTGRKKEILVLSDGTKIFLPEYEGELAAVLPGRDFAVAEKGGAPYLVIKGGASDRAAILSSVRPVMELRPRGQQIRDIIFTPHPLPRTATGKIKRWELQL